MSEKRRGFRIGKWNGVENYECDFCPFAAPGKRGLARIKEHVARHLLLGHTSSRELPGIIDVDMTERAGEIVAGYVDAGHPEIVEALKGRTRSGKTGYTVADVEDAAAALNLTTPSEEDGS